jgi:hypothetical protein
MQDKPPGDAESSGARELSAVSVLRRRSALITDGDAIDTNSTYAQETARRPS